MDPATRVQTLEYARLCNGVGRHCIYCSLMIAVGVVVVVQEHIDLLRDVQGRRSMGEVVDIDEEIKRRTTTRQFANVEVQGAGHDSDADSGVEGAGVGTGAGAGAAAGLGAAAAAPAGAVAGGGGGGGGGAFDHTADPFADDFFANADGNGAFVGVCGVFGAHMQSSHSLPCRCVVSCFRSIGGTSTSRTTGTTRQTECCSRIIVSGSNLFNELGMHAAI